MDIVTCPVPLLLDSYLQVAGGSGIAPFIGLLQELETRGSVDHGLTAASPICSFLRRAELLLTKWSAHHS